MINILLVFVLTLAQALLVVGVIYAIVSVPGIVRRQRDILARLDTLERHLASHDGLTPPAA